MSGILSNLESGVENVAGKFESAASNLATAAGLKKAEADVEADVQKVEGFVAGPFVTEILSAMAEVKSQAANPVVAALMEDAGISPPEEAVIAGFAVKLATAVTVYLTAAQTLAAKAATVIPATPATAAAATQATTTTK